MSPLHVVATLGLTKLLDMLVKAGADVNLVAKHNGDTPLHAAVRRGHLDFVKALLKVLDARERERARARGGFEIAHQRSSRVGFLHTRRPERTMNRRWS